MSLVFSTLSEIESETLKDNFLEECISMFFTIAFIGGVSLDFSTLSLLSLVLFAKFFHILCDLRLESVCSFYIPTPHLFPLCFDVIFFQCLKQMQQDANFNARRAKFLGVLIGLLICFDGFMVWTLWKSYVASPTIMMSFTAFQFFLLLIDALYVCCKAIMIITDRANNNSWDRRPEAVLYVEVAHTFLHQLALPISFL